jgi:hypothetical protein
MIEINLLPGTGKKSRSKSAGVNFGGAAAAVASRVKDPYLIGAVSSVLVAAAAIGAMFWYQQGREMRLNENLRSAQQDSIRFASVIRNDALIRARLGRSSDRSHQVVRQQALRLAAPDGRDHQSAAAVHLADVDHSNEPSGGQRSGAGQREASRREGGQQAQGGGRR